MPKELGAFERHIEIDWVDFIKLDGKEYDGIYTGVIADPEDIGETVGEVQFKVADEVTNPNYKIKDGDAAFWEKGTTIYAVKNDSSLRAVKDEHEINGYRVYQVREDEKGQSWHFKDMPQDKVKKIELYKRNEEGTYTLLKHVTEIREFLSLLNRGEQQSDFIPDTSEGDPVIFQMVFYTDSPIAYNFSLHFDGKVFFWHPWDTTVLPGEIKTYLNHQIN